LIRIIDSANLTKFANGWSKTLVLDPLLVPFFSTQTPSAGEGADRGEIKNSSSDRVQINFNDLDGTLKKNHTQKISPQLLAAH
jgi:hypothetical protein